MTVALLQDAMCRLAIHIGTGPDFRFGKIRPDYYFFCSRPIICPDRITVSRE